jgi:hypothetical protein
MANEKIAGFGDLNLKKKVILSEITVQCVIAIYIKGSCNITCALCSRAKVRGQTWK